MNRQVASPTVRPPTGVQDPRSARLEVRDLSIEYSSGGYVVRPIEGFDLDSKGGELVLLLGASGCGKTTLLSVFAGILTPTAGSVLIGSTQVLGLSGAALTK